MATDETQIVHPGDIVQDSEGQFYLVASTHKWGVGAVQRWTDAGEVRETYSRLRPGQFVVVGTGHLLPEEVAQARRDSLQLSAQLAREALVADPEDLTPQWDVEVRFNGRTTGPGQKHSERVKAESIHEALDKVRLPLGQHGGAAFLVGATVDNVHPHPALGK